MNTSLQDYLDHLGTDVNKHIPHADDIKSDDALRRTHAMTVALLEHAQTLIRQAEQEINAQAKRIEALEDMAVTDELTGLLNRRGFEGAVKREMDFMKRNQAGPGVFVIIDLDKYINCFISVIFFVKSFLEFTIFMYFKINLNPSTTPMDIIQAIWH